MVLPLNELKKRKEELEKDLLNPNFLTQYQESKNHLKELARIDRILQAQNTLLSYEKKLEDLETYLKEETDPELLLLGEEEKQDLFKQIQEQKKEVEDLCLPENPYEGRPLFLEIRAGAGGDEASLFVGDLARLYEQFCLAQKLKLEVVENQPGAVGGYKEWIASIKGKNAYRFLQFESGVHRVQRVPNTESSGRIHTSTVTIAVLPEAEESELEINEKDLRIDTYRASGAGGQHVNKTDSAVRITHLPTGVVVSCQESRSQIKNREQAFRVLRAKLKKNQDEQQKKEEKEARQAQVGRGDRSERIRTYNYNQRRITDHRLQKSYFHFQDFFNGNILELIQDLLDQKKQEDLQNQTLHAPSS